MCVAAIGNQHTSKTLLYIYIYIYITKSATMFRTLYWELAVAFRGVEVFVVVLLRPTSVPVPDLASQ